VLDKQPLEKLPGILSKCHLGVSIRDSTPLSQKSFPVRVWEYIGLGLPVVVAPDNSEAGFFVSDNGIGSIVALDCDVILNEILRYSYNRETYLAYQSKVFSVRHLYTRERFAKELVDASIYSFNFKNKGGNLCVD
jgi:hypothetical protein